MEGEDRCGKIRSRHGKPAQRQGRQQGDEAMQPEIDQVIATRIICPESVLQPESAVHQRVMLLGRSQVEPDPPQPLQRAQLGTGDVGLVVPDQPAVPDGSIDEEDHGDQRGGEQQFAHPERSRRTRRRCELRGWRISRESFSHGTPPSDAYGLTKS
jgi:hypothetical protein